MGVFSVFDFITTDFVTHTISRRRALGAYVDGIWHDGGEQVTQHKACVQPLTDQELVALDIGGKRVSDFRKIYITNGQKFDLDSNDVFSLPDTAGEFATVQTDIRPENDYIKLIVARRDT